MDDWDRHLENSSLNILPTDYVVPSEGRIVEADLSVPVPCSVCESITGLANKLDSTPPAVAAALWSILVHRYTGDEDVVVGSFTPNETKLAVLRVPFSNETTIGDVVSAVDKSYELAERYPTTYAAVRERYGEKFRTISSVTTVPELGKDIVVAVDMETVIVQYNSLLYKKRRIEFMVEQLFTLATELAANSSARVSAIPLNTTNQPLPDPSADLDWASFRGAIQDVFSANAAKFPDRIAVLETGTPSRQFTYRQLDEASNAVANKLVNSGIEVDDVVMIYAYRGVDLVVAVMGTLKAGATFSVIDPAYPPERQNIYLSVAKPQALIVLAKAGTLSREVRQYIDSELPQLKVEIQGLELNEAGVAPLPSSISVKNPGIKVGPDNHPTLSFTSGSEGVPKGVRGRHFSLTYYFPWMAERFGLSDQDKFTMLSGIAHDPIQRDMFTPLFLGAQLLVPTAEDIGTPGQLAEWFAKHGATVTHLTPAMGQLLNAQATAHIPKLRSAFFVGDVLTKRDCTKLQALAPNVAVINMYGTTETQRAVSYFRVPSRSDDREFLSTQKDTIPAGTGMLNVQMLIVNRHDRTRLCGVGEVGEVYVRAGGLSDGYLSLPDMTAEKFLTNWFPSPALRKAKYDGPGLWLGPRDRLYRTGDLGRYLPDGTAEVSGRADDQVKIRGFRIELGEINTHLSRHPKVSENVTLVRRNKDEEPILVSYVVPEAHEQTHSDNLVSRLIHYKDTLRDIREYLKTKLPGYAVPSLIVPMSKLPLNPNGKIDKPRLPFPDTAQLELAASATASDAQWTPTEAAVRDLWLEILPTRPPSLEPSDSFFDVGGHSILATKLVFEARSRFGVADLPLSSVFSEPTLQGFAAAIEKFQSEGSDSASAPENSSGIKSSEYSEDAEKLVKELPHFAKASIDAEAATVFLTGASGFLGAFILRDLLSRPKIRVVAHVRARDAAHGLERLKTTGLAYGTWPDDADSRVKVVVGSLEDKHLGMSAGEWRDLSTSVDVVIHNGALVNWAYPYATLRGPNVLGTLEVLKFCSEGTPKSLAFVSSTSVLDVQHYLELSEELVSQGLTGVPESDSLEGSRHGLGTGYGQSKWAGERLVREAIKQGLTGAVVRPGYIVGDSVTGVSNTDDFLIRLLKGSQELGMYPDIANGINMVPVDHVARVTVATALHPGNSEIDVVQVTAHPRMSFSTFLGSLADWGYTVKETEYVEWRVALEKFVLESNESALFPLLHFVLDNLPQNTQAAELDDSNAHAVLKADAAVTGVDLSSGAGVSHELLGVYVSFLVAVGFLPEPKNSAMLPPTKASKGVLANFASAGGRTK